MRARVPKGQGKGSGDSDFDQKAPPNKPGRKHRSKGSNNGYQERINLSPALGRVDSQAGANRMQRVGRIGSKANAVP